MNDIAGPATGLDMLFLFADANSANRGSVAGDVAMAMFEEVLGSVSDCKPHPRKAAAGDVQLPDTEPGPQSTTLRERELTPAYALPLEFSHFPTVPLTTGPSAEGREVRVTAEVCYAASEFEGQSTVGDVNAVPVLVDATPNLSTSPPSPITGAHSDDDPISAEVKLSPSSTTGEADKLLRDAKIDVRSISENEFANALIDVPLPAEATRFEPVRSAELAVSQLRDAVIRTAKPHVLVRVQRTVADSSPQRQAKETKALADRSNQSSTALEPTSFEAATQTRDSEVGATGAAEVTAPTLVDELAADAGQFDSKRDEIVVELNIPDWGVLEIEVTRDGDETEVSLLADPAVNQLIRDHLPELTEALSASGIELAGLDVRQHDHEHHTGEGHDVFLPVEMTESGRGKNNDDVHFADAAIRTGLSRYRLMSITA